MSLLLKAWGEREFRLLVVTGMRGQSCVGSGTKGGRRRETQRKGFAKPAGNRKREQSQKYLKGGRRSVINPGVQGGHQGGLKVGKRPKVSWRILRRRGGEKRSRCLDGGGKGGKSRETNAKGGRNCQVYGMSGGYGVFQRNSVMEKESNLT